MKSKNTNAKDLSNPSLLGGVELKNRVVNTNTPLSS